MDINRLKLFASLGERMRWLNERQRVLAENVANANTPGYKARDVAEPDFAKLLAGTSSRLALATTAQGHLAGGAGADGKHGSRVRERPADVTASGNTVMLEEEMMKVSQTASEYELTSGLYAKHLGMLRLAIGRGGRG